MIVAYDSQPGWTGGEPGSAAARSSVSAGSGSISSSIARTAAAAWAIVSAATAATASPTKRTTPSASSVWSMTTQPVRPGASAAVITARTPGMAAACAVSSRTMRPDGTRERRMRPCSRRGSS